MSNDASVCETQNKPAFDKLRQALAMHYHVRDKAVSRALAKPDRRSHHAKEIVAQHPQAALEAKQLGGDTPGQHRARRADSGSEAPGMNTDLTLAQSHDIATKVARCFTQAGRVCAGDPNSRNGWRMLRQRQRHRTRLSSRIRPQSAKVWTDWYSFAVDATQRSILFWDTIRQRGNSYGHSMRRRDFRPCCAATTETVDLERPQSSRSVPSVTRSCASVPPRGRDGSKPAPSPIIIIDPEGRAAGGHGHLAASGRLAVGDCGAAVEGHPDVYALRDLLYAIRNPSQTLLEACAEAREGVRAHGAQNSITLAPRSPRSIGNCQGGWSAIECVVLAAKRIPQLTAGPDRRSTARRCRVRGGAWQDGGGGNPDAPLEEACSRCRGSRQLTSDLGRRHPSTARNRQSENFRGISAPRTAFWDKYYPRFPARTSMPSRPPLFPQDSSAGGEASIRMNREEDRVDHTQCLRGRQGSGRGETLGPDGEAFDLRGIKGADRPLRLDGRLNLHAACNRRSQLGRRRCRRGSDRRNRVARPGDRRPHAREHRPPRHFRCRARLPAKKKEHAQIVVGAEIDQRCFAGQACTLMKEDRRAHQGRAGGWNTTSRSKSARSGSHRGAAQPVRAGTDEEAVRGRRRDLRLQPAGVRTVPPAAGAEAASGEYGAKLRRQFHPLRMQRWSLVDLNPWLAWVAPAAGSSARSAPTWRRTMPCASSRRRHRHAISASLDYYRAMRDAMKRSGVLHHATQQRVLALHCRQARGRARVHRRAARAAVRQGRRSHRSAKAEYPGRSRGSPACSRARAGRFSCLACR